MIEVSKIIHMDLGDILPQEDWDFDRVLDLVSEKATGTILLQDIGMIPVGVEPDGTLRVRITGFVDDEEMSDDERDHMETLLNPENIEHKFS